MSDFTPPGPDLANFVDVWRPREFTALELHRGSEVTVEYPRHWHDEFYLSATLSGASYVECAGASFSVARGQLVLLPPGVVHANQKMACTARTMFLEFKALRDAVEGFMEQRTTGPDFRTAIIDNPRTVHAFLQLHRSLEAPRFELAQEHALVGFLSKLAARYSVATPFSTRDGHEDAAVQRTREFLEAHYADRVLLGDLARATRVSPYRLNRAFRRRVGMPPHAYQMQLRLAHAKRQLRLGRSVSDTASLAGFFDQSHFVHAFKRSEGMPPSEYARLRKNLQDGALHTYYFR